MVCRNFSSVVLMVYIVEIGYGVRFLFVGRYKECLFLKNGRRLIINVWCVSFY